MGTLTLIGGGSRSGKSAFAAELAESRGTRRVFVATAQALDPEMSDRIARHRAERGERFETIECPVDVPGVIWASNHASVVLVDCLTLWISNLLGAGLGDREILGRVDQLILATGQISANVIVVSNEVGMGLVSEYELGRRFQDLTGWAHQRLAAAAHEVYLAAIGCVLQLLPGPVQLARRARTPDNVADDAGPATVQSGTR
jgi:adenosylcobinamide kinase/adenosylcobinamide-phosphate guanylyltransferase